jgi:hypothetical protein
MVVVVTISAVVSVAQVFGGSKLDPRSVECRLVLGYTSGNGNYKGQLDGWWWTRHGGGRVWTCFHQSTANFVGQRGGGVATVVDLVVIAIVVVSCRCVVVPWYEERKQSQQLESFKVRNYHVTMLIFF